MAFACRDSLIVFIFLCRIMSNVVLPPGFPLLNTFMKKHVEIMWADGFNKSIWHLFRSGENQFDLYFPAVALHTLTIVSVR